MRAIAMPPTAAAIVLPTRPDAELVVSSDPSPTLPSLSLEPSVMVTTPEPAARSTNSGNSARGIQRRSGPQYRPSQQLWARSFSGSNLTPQSMALSPFSAQNAVLPMAAGVQTGSPDSESQYNPSQHKNERPSLKVAPQFTTLSPSSPQVSMEG